MYGSGSTERDYTYIDDIVNGIILALNYQKTKYEIINLGSSHPITLKEMIQTIEKCLNKKAIIIQKSEQLGDVKRTSCNGEKAKKLLGFYPKVSFENGIKNFIKYLEEE